MEEECQAQKTAYTCGEANHEEPTGGPLGLEFLDDVVKEEMEVTRRLEVYHEGPESQLIESGLTPIGTRRICCTNKGDAAHPFVRARLIAQETEQVTELTPEDASRRFAATPPHEGLRYSVGA